MEKEGAEAPARMAADKARTMADVRANFERDKLDFSVIEAETAGELTTAMQLSLIHISSGKAATRPNWPPTARPLSTRCQRSRCRLLNRHRCANGCARHTRPARRWPAGT